MANKHRIPMSPRLGKVYDEALNKGLYQYIPSIVRAAERAERCFKNHNPHASLEQRMAAYELGLQRAIKYHRKNGDVYMIRLAQSKSEFKRLSALGVRCKLRQGAR